MGTEVSACVTVTIQSKHKTTVYDNSITTSKQWIMNESSTAVVILASQCSQLIYLFSVTNAVVTVDCFASHHKLHGETAHRGCHETLFMDIRQLCDL